MENKKTTKKQDILNIAQQLFYKEGLKNTSFDQIARECGITKPLITYHFGTKSNLAGEIFGKYSNEMMDLFFLKAEKVFPQNKKFDILSAFSLKQLHYYREDERAFKFYCEFFSSGVEDYTIGIEDIYNKMNTYVDIDIEPTKRHMIYIGTNYAARGLIYHYVAGNIKCSKEEFEEFYLMNSYLNYGISKETVKTNIIEANKILEKTEIKYLPGFVWE